MSNRHWRKSQSEDFFVKDSRERGYRSRSVYKLLEIDQKYKIFKNVKSLVDIGSTPGGWSEYAKSKIRSGNLLAVDINSMDPIEGVTFIQGSIEDKEIQDLIFIQVHGESIEMGGLNARRCRNKATDRI